MGGGSFLFLCKNFVFLFLFLVLNILLSNCVVRDSLSSENFGDSECDIFTQRCPRSGSGFSIGKSRSNRSSRSPAAPAPQTPPETQTGDGFSNLPQEAKDARDYLCEEYEDMFEEISDGLSINHRAETIEFRNHVILTPEFDYTSGCLRVRSIDDPSTEDEESEEFDVVCIEDTRLYLTARESEDLRDVINEIEDESIDIKSSAWRSAVDALDDDEQKDFLRSRSGSCNDPEPRNTAELKRAADEDIKEIYDIRDELVRLLQKIRNGISRANTFRRNLDKIIQAINKFYAEEAKFVQQKVKEIECEEEKESVQEDNSLEADAKADQLRALTNEIDEAKEEITDIESDMTENDSDFSEVYNDVKDEVLLVLNDRISKSDRDDLVERLLKRLERDLRRKLIICVYQEGDNCLSPSEARILEQRASLEHLGEFKSFTRRRYRDRYATRVECELREGNTCTDVNPEVVEACSDISDPVDKRICEKAVDDEIENFDRALEGAIELHFLQPFGVACPSD